MTAHCSTCTCSVGEPIPRPATSSEWARREALARTAEAITASREARKKPKTDEKENDHA